MNPQDLKELGLETAANKLERGQSLKRKMAIAYENYRFVSPDIFDRFGHALLNKTLRQTQWPHEINYDKLVFIPLAKYPHVPPPDCLLDLKKARDLQCFDSFEVAKIEAVVERKDPIIFGIIDGCADKFCVTQWDDDVKIEDILKEGEG